MPRFRPRISLLSALLLMTIAGMAIVTVQLGVEIGPLRHEVARLRTEQGLLVLEDETQVHAIQLQSLDENVWKYRVYIPPGRVFRVYLAVNEIPAEGLPDFERSTRSSVLGYAGDGVFADLVGGEHLLTVGVFHNQRGIPCVGFERQGPGAPPLSSLRLHEKTKWPRQPAEYATVDGVDRSTQRADSKGELVLIRYRATNVAPDHRVSYIIPVRGPPSGGFLLWIEPLPARIASTSN